MPEPQSLRTAEDYRPALLWLMGRLKQATTEVALREFEREFGDRIPPEHYERNASGHVKWDNYVRWARQHLINAGLMGSGGRGIWTITPEGQQWLAEHPDGGGDELKALIQATWRDKSGASGRGRRGAAQTAPPPALQAEGMDRPVEFTVAGHRFRLSGRQVLEQARRALVHGVPPAALRHQGWVVDVDGQPIGVKWLFSLVTGLSVEQFDSGRARAILRRLGIEPYHQARATRVAPAKVTARRRPRQEPAQETQRRYTLVDAEIRAIRDFLDGRASSHPSDERLCYWVYLCLTLELYAEGWRLFTLVDRSQVQKPLYEYTHRFAEVCRIRAEV